MSAKHVTYKSYTPGPCFQIFTEPIPSIIKTAQQQEESQHGQREERRQPSSGRPCPGQEQHPCTAWVWQGWQTSGGRTPIGHTAHSLGLAGAHTGLPSVADLAAKCCILCHLVGISVLLLVFLTRFPSLTLAASSSSWDLLALCWDSKDLGKMDEPCGWVSADIGGPRASWFNSLWFCWCGRNLRMWII